MESDERIAIVGIGALVPDALDPASLWRNLMARHSAVREVPKELWDAEHYYGQSTDGEDRTTSRLGGVVRGFRFSAREFGIPPSVDVDLDLTQKGALVAARAALAEIGIHGPSSGVRAAVIIGNGMGGSQMRAEGVMLLSHRLLASTIDQLPSFRGLPPSQRSRILSELRAGWCSQFPRINSNSLPGALGNIIAARVAHYYNFHGPTHTIDAACASSLAALESAVNGLKARRYDLALAGGVDFSMDPVAFVSFSRMSALSNAGSFPFDTRASGFVMGEGAVLFALKRLSDARRANDHVYALVEGIGSSSDGRGSSIVAPNQKGQRLALRNAYADAGVSPTAVGYVEAHGTATPIGDPIEILALREVYADCPRGSVALGSVKANLGHMKAAAGGAGLLRAILTLNAGIIPPQANFEKANPRCKLDTSPFHISTEARDWPRGKTHAVVSALGFGGINYHVVLRQAPEAHRAPMHGRRPVRETPRRSARAHGVVALGAADADALLRTASGVADRLERGMTLDAALPKGACEPREAAARLTFYALDAVMATPLLALAIAGLRGEASAARLQAAGIYVCMTPPLKSDAVAMMFPGQGSQYLGMLDELRAHFPIVEETLREADTILSSEFAQPLSSYFACTAAPGESADERDRRFAALARTEVLQPVMVACNEALRRALLEFCSPTLTFGHSLGEISACIAAGVMTFEEGLQLAALRGKLLASAEESAKAIDGGTGGALLQAAAPVDAVERALGDLIGVTIANKNCLRQTVIGGHKEAMDAALGRLRSAGIECSILPVSQAFHTPRMRSAVAPLREHLERLPLFAPRVTFLSSVSGTAMPKGAKPHDWFADVLSRQVAEPVEFIDTLRHAYEGSARIFIEVGPKRALCGFVDDVLAGSEKEAVGCCVPKEGERKSFGRVLCVLVANGLIPWQVPTMEDLLAAPFPRRAPHVGRIAEPIVDPTTAPAPDPAVASAASDALESFMSGKFTAALDGVDRDPDFWRYFARQSDSMMKFVAASYRAAATHASARDSALAQMRSAAAPPVDPEASLDWLIAHSAAWLDYPLAEMRLDAPLEDDIGVDIQRQHELLGYLAAKLGRKVSLPPPHAGFATLRILFAALEDFSKAVPNPTAPPVHPVVAVEPRPRPFEKPSAVAVDPRPRPFEKPSPVTVDPRPRQFEKPSAVAHIERPVPLILPGVATAGTAPTAPERVPAPQPERNASSSVEDQILTLLMTRTGYSRSELQLDADLQEVLGIDSIAQLEMVAELQDQLDLPPDESFRVANYPTLRQLIAYVEGKLTPAVAAPAPVSAPEPVLPIVETDRVPESTCGAELFEWPYFCRQLRKEPLPAHWDPAMPGRTLILHDDGSPALLKRMAGAALTFTEAEGTGLLLPALNGGIDSLVILASVPCAPEESALGAAHRAAARVCTIGRALLSAAAAPRPVLLIVGGNTRALSDEAWRGAWVGAWKSFCREWCAARSDFGSRDLRVIEVSGLLDMQLDSIMSVIDHAGPAEAHLEIDGTWTSRVLREITLPAKGHRTTPPVALLTGGARGITARVALALFEATRCKLILAGRSLAADSAAPFDLAGERHRARQLMGPEATLSEITSEVEMRRRVNEVAQTIEALRNRGADVQYVSSDFTREGELARVIAGANLHFGGLDWIVHGAGVDLSRSLLAKTDSDQLPVLAPKLAGLDEAAFNAGGGAKWIAISSVSALFGNAGQLEYASANEAMARCVLARGGTVLDFGPWRDTGMAAPIQGVLKNRGVDSLPSGAAAATAAALIAGGMAGEYVLAGRLGRDAGTIAGRPVSVEFDVPGTQYAVAAIIDYDRLAWLRDHSWRGVGLLPAVVSLAMMIDAARCLEPGARITSIHSLSLREPVIVRRGQSQTLRITAERAAAGDSVAGIAVDAKVLLAGRVMHSAVVRIGAQPPKVAGCTEPPVSVGRRLERAQIYDLAFHGPTFQVLDAVTVAGRQAMGESVPLDASMGVDLPDSSRGSALAREVALQTVGVYLAAERSAIALPESFNRADIYGAPALGERVRAKVLCRPDLDGEPSFAVFISGEDGRLLEHIEGLRFRRTATTVSVPAERVHALNAEMADDMAS